MSTRQVDPAASTRPASPAGPLSIRVAIAQLELQASENAANGDRLRDALRSALDGGADLIVMPELASSGYRLGAWRAALAASEPIPGPTTERWQAELAGTQAVVVGGICERDGGALYNSAAIVSSDGVLDVYRKLHLFDEERLLFQPGDRGLPVVRTPFANIGVLICYDLRFPEAMRILALQGADVIAVPTAWAPGYDRTPPPDGIIDQVRAAAVQANFNQVYVAAASRVGADGDLPFLGSSVVIDPYGRFVDGPASGTEEALSVAGIDVSDARRAKVRSQLITPLADRRTDVYGELLGYTPPAV